MLMAPQHDDELAVIAVGAFERDNFGDLLYRDLVAQLLTSASIRFAAPFGAPATEFADRVGRVSPVLEDEDIDVIWAVGGEVGATSLEEVYRTAFGEEATGELRSLDRAARNDVLRERLGGPLLDSPYIPRPSAHPRNSTARLVINSAGIASIGVQPTWRRIQLYGVLREAAFISVRDQKSSDVLRREGIEHVLSPDFAHVLAEVGPPAEPTNIVTVQISDDLITEFGVHAWADALAASEELRQHPLRLLLAGTAHGHDSEDAAEQIVALLHDVDRDWSITVSTSRGVWPRIAEIASSALWLGSSLHGRIVAYAYGVPRISLRKGKLDTYAKTWDPDSPWGVTPDSLPAAVRAAFAAEPVDPTELSRQARESFDAAVRAARADDSDGGARVLAARVRESGQLADNAADLLQQLQTALADRDAALQRLAASEAEDRRKTHAVAESRRKTQAVAEELSRLRRSKTYRFGNLLALPVRKARSVANKLRGRAR